MKHLFLMMSLFIAFSLKAQPFLSMTGTTKGVGFSIGFLDQQSGIEFSSGYHVPVLRADLPWLFNISVGKRILLSHKEEDNFTITPSIGYADYSVKDFSQYEEEGEHPIVKIKEIRAIYKIELGKDWHLGRVYITANYCKNVFWGVGLRAFIK